MVEARLRSDEDRPPAGEGGELPAIQLEQVVKHFPAGSGDVAAVERVDLSIAEGEFFSLLGPSGCGKTTTLRMIAGFEEPTGGRILLHGRDVVGVPPYRRDVNMVFQNYALFPHMDVFDNVAFGLRRKKVPGGEIRRRVGEMLDLVELGGREHRRPTQLSGGQQQRVALAGRWSTTRGRCCSTSPSVPSTSSCARPCSSSSSASSARSASPSCTSPTTRARP